LSASIANALRAFEPTFGEEGVKIQATLVAIAVDGAVMDRLVKQLGDLRMVSQAYWSASTTEQRRSAYMALPGFARRTSGRAVAPER
jgi:hypothetical protein